MKIKFPKYNFLCLDGKLQTRKLPRLNIEIGICYRPKELRALYPHGYRRGNTVYVEHYLEQSRPWTWLSWIKAKSQSPSSPCHHSEKIRLNRYSRRRVRLALHIDPETDCDLRPVRINPRDIE